MIFDYNIVLDIFFCLFYTGCGPLPVIPNLVFETTLQQNPNKYSFGDKFTARCLNFGEELLNDHSGEIECLKTMKWSKLPVCKSKNIFTFVLAEKVLPYRN